MKREWNLIEKSLVESELQTLIMGIKKTEPGSGKVELVNLIQDARSRDVSPIGF